jgi:lipopolysaccharide biosynthesis regulator YciM
MSRAALAAAVLLIAACSKKQEITAPPPPLRPEPEAVADTSKKVQKDCEVITAEMELKPMAFDQRAITESSRLSEGARQNLKLAESAEVERVQQEEHVTGAVHDLITALLGDPYNVQATYVLAKAYARINRPQCSMNLLVRLLQMRSHPSRRAMVESYLDQLLGRKQALDPDFSEMRRDDRFRELIKKMCEGTNDANCVYGAQRDNRER